MFLNNCLHTLYFSAEKSMCVQMYVSVCYFYVQMPHVSHVF